MNIVDSDYALALEELDKIAPGVRPYWTDDPVEPPVAKRLICTEDYRRNQMYPGNESWGVLLVGGAAMVVGTIATALFVFWPR